MWNPFGKHPAEHRGFKTLVVLIALALGAILAGAAPAQEKPAVSSEAGLEAGGLRQQIEQRYQVLPIHGGVVLTPKQPRRGVQTIEVSGGDVAVNGERVNTRTLQDWLGEDATPVLGLLNLDPGQRRALFGLAAESGLPPAAPEEPAATPAAGTPEPPTAPEAPEPPSAPGSEPSIHSGERVRFGGSIVVEKDELAEEAVAIGGSVRVDGEVNRDAVAVGGPVRINGHVGGNVTSVGGTVHLGPEAVVEGDVTSVGGTIERAKGAQIHGSESEVGMSPFRTGPWRHGWDDDWDIDHDFGPFSFFGASMRVFGSLVWLAALVLFSWLCLLLARGPMERVERRIAAEPWKAAGIGLAGSFALVPLLFVVGILLVITIIGCIFLLLYPVLAVVLFFVYLFAYATVALRVGRWMEERFSRRFGSPYLSVLVGVILLHGWSVIGQLLSLGPGLLDLFALMFKLFAFFITVGALMLGFGGILLVAFGSQTWLGRTGQPASPIPVVPPAPYAGESEPLPLSEQWEEPPPPPER
jgi:hypothetical protein